MSRVVCYNFDSRIQERDIDFLFSKYGRLESLEFRPDSAFVTYFDERDARDAVSVLNRHTFEGCELRVEFVNGDSRRDSADRGRDSDRRRSEHSSSRREPERDERGRDRRDDRGRDFQHPYPSAPAPAPVFPPSAPREYYDSRGAGARPPPQPRYMGGGGAGGGGGSGTAHDGYRGPIAAARTEHLFCLGCNQRGHWARDCPDPASRGKCFNCQQPGHTARDCPQPRGQRQGQRQGQAQAQGGAGYQDRGQPPHAPPPQQQQHVARGRSRSRSPQRRSASPRR